MSTHLPSDGEMRRRWAGAPSPFDVVVLIANDGYDEVWLHGQRRLGYIHRDHPGTPWIVTSVTSTTFAETFDAGVWSLLDECAPYTAALIRRRLIST